MADNIFVQLMTDVKARELIRFTVVILLFKFFKPV